MALYKNSHTANYKIESRHTLKTNKHCDVAPIFPSQCSTNLLKGNRNRVKIGFWLLIQSCFITPIK